MDTINTEEIEQFCWDHKENGCVGIKSGLKDEDGLLLNTTWRDSVTGEEIKVKYDFKELKDRSKNE